MTPALAPVGDGKILSEAHLSYILAKAGEEHRRDLARSARTRLNEQLGFHVATVFMWATGDRWEIPVRNDLHVMSDAAEIRGWLRANATPRYQ